MNSIAIIQTPRSVLLDNPTYSVSESVISLTTVIAYDCLIHCPKHMAFYKVKGLPPALLDLFFTPASWPHLLQLSLSFGKTPINRPTGRHQSAILVCKPFSDTCAYCEGN